MLSGGKTIIVRGQGGLIVKKFCLEKPPVLQKEAAFTKAGFSSPEVLFKVKDFYMCLGGQ